jgi:branched-chain amino acid transport system substrate-binding protein
MPYGNSISSLALLCAAAFIGIGVTSSLAETKGPVTDELGVVEIPEGAPILIGGYWPFSGAERAFGIDQQRGSELALDDHNNELLGHPLRLITEDDQCTPAGGQRAATRLTANTDILVVVGPGCSSSATAAAPVLWKAGIVSIGTAASSPSLTAADRAESLQGFMRTMPNDLEQAVADAKYIAEELQCKRLATVHDGTPYTEQLVSSASEHFKELGGEIVATETVTPTDVDMRPMLTNIATGKPCVIYFPIFTTAGAQLVRQLPEIAGLEGVVPLAGSAMASPHFLEAAGEAAVGVRFGKIDASPESRGEAYPALLEKYVAKYGEPPTEVFHANAYDAVKIALAAIEKVAKEADGNLYIGRKALRDALFATNGYEGLSGQISCGTQGDCAEFNEAVYEWVSSDPATFEIGINPKKIYPTE